MGLHEVWSYVESLPDRVAASKVSMAVEKYMILLTNCTPVEREAARRNGDSVVCEILLQNPADAFGVIETLVWKAVHLKAAADDVSTVANEFLGSVVRCDHDFREFVKAKVETFQEEQPNNLRLTRCADILDSIERARESESALDGAVDAAVASSPMPSPAPVDESALSPIEKQQTESVPPVAKDENPRRSPTNLAAPNVSKHSAKKTVAPYHYYSVHQCNPSKTRYLRIDSPTNRHSPSRSQVKGRTISPSQGSVVRPRQGTTTASPSSLVKRRSPSPQSSRARRSPPRKSPIVENKVLSIAERLAANANTRLSPRSVSSPVQTDPDVVELHNQSLIQRVEEESEKATELKTTTEVLAKENQWLVSMLQAESSAISTLEQSIKEQDLRTEATKIHAQEAVDQLKGDLRSEEILKEILQHSKYRLENELSHVSSRLDQEAMKSYHLREENRQLTTELKQLQLKQKKVNDELATANDEKDRALEVAEEWKSRFDTSMEAIEMHQHEKLVADLQIQVRQLSRVKDRFVQRILSNLGLRRDGFLKSTTLRHWISEYTRKRKVQRLMSHAMDFWKGNRVPKLFRGWSGLIQEEKRLARARQKIILRWKNQALHTCYESWAGYCADAKLTRTKVAKLLTSGEQRGLVRGFNQWCEVWTSNRKNRAMLKRAAAAFRNKYVLATFTAWKDDIQMEKSRVEGLDRIRRHWLNQTKASAFRSWIEALDMIQHAKGVFARVRGRWLNRGLSLCLRAWQQFAIDSVFEKVETSKSELVQRLTDTQNELEQERALRLAAERKIEALERSLEDEKRNTNRARLEADELEQRLQKDLDALVKDNKAQRKRLLHMTLAPWGGNYVPMCFSAWNDLVFGKQAAKRKLDSVARVLLNRKLFVGFNTWSTNVAEERQRKNIMRRVALKMKNRVAHMSFDSWVAVVEDKKRNQRILAKAIVTFQNRDVKRALGTWSERLYEKKLLKKVQIQLTGSRESRRLARMVAAWRRFIAESQQEREEASRTALEMEMQRLQDALDSEKKAREESENAARSIEDSFQTFRMDTVTQHDINQKKVMIRIQRLLMKQVVPSAFSAWSMVLKEKKRKERILAKVRSRWLNAVVFRVMSAWIEMVAEKRRMVNVAKKVVLRWQQGALVRVWNCWVGFFQEQTTNRRILEKVKSRWMNKSLAMGFNSWAENTNEAKVWRHKIKTTVVKWTRGCLTRCYNSWKEIYQEAKRNRVMLQRVKNMWMNKSLHLCFKAWRKDVLNIIRERNMDIHDKYLETTETLEVERSQWTEEKSEMIDRIAQLEADLQSFRKKSVRVEDDLQQQALALAAQRQEFQESIIRSLRRTMGRSTQQNCFMSWKDYCGTNKKTQRALARAAGKWRNKGLAYGFEKLADHALTRKLYKQKVGKMLSRMLSGNQRTIFLAWRNVSVMRIRDRGRVARVKALIERKKVEAAINKWKSRPSKKFIESKVRVLMYKVLQRSFVNTFVAWLEYHAVEQRKKSLKDTCIRRWVNGVASMVFNSWIEYVEERAWRKDVVNKFGLRWARRWFEKCFRAWCTYMRDVHRTSDFETVLTSLNERTVYRQVFFALKLEAKVGIEVRTHAHRRGLFRLLKASFDGWKGILLWRESLTPAIEGMAQQSLLSQVMKGWYQLTAKRLSVRAFYSQLKHKRLQRVFLEFVMVVREYRYEKELEKAKEVVDLRVENLERQLEGEKKMRFVLEQKNAALKEQVESMNDLVMLEMQSVKRDIEQKRTDFNSWRNVMQSDVSTLQYRIEAASNLPPRSPPR